MICGMKIFVFAALFFCLEFELCFCECSKSSYEADGECCSKCAPGNHVQEHCTENTGTNCAPCPGSTFTVDHNGLTECTKCTVCDPGQGLRIKTPCTQSSDTVCEPLDGHYCTDQGTDTCRRADKHTNCRPGQYVKQRGTAIKDTECGGCENGTYSDGSFQTCKPHSKCEDSGRSEIKPGTLSSDTECRPPVALIVGVTVTAFIVVVAVVCAIIAVIVVLCRRYKRKTGVEPPTEPPVESKTVSKLAWLVTKWFIHEKEVKIIGATDVQKIEE